MKKIKLVICAIMLLLCGIMFTGCGKKYDFDGTLITVICNDDAVTYNTEKDEYTLVYDGETHFFDLKYETELTDFEVTYSLDGKTFSPASEIGIKDVGEYSISYKLTAKKHNDYVGENKIKLNVLPRSINVYFNDAIGLNNYTYDQAKSKALSSMTYSQTNGPIDGDIINYDITLTTQFGNDTVEYGNKDVVANEVYQINVTCLNCNYELIGGGEAKGAYFVAATYGINISGWRFYNTLEEAGEAANNSTTKKTIKMFADVNENGEINAFSNVTANNIEFDLNGHTLKKRLVIDNHDNSANLKLTIKDSSSAGEIGGLSFNLNSNSIIKVEGLKVNSSNVSANVSGEGKVVFKNATLNGATGIRLSGGEASFNLCQINAIGEFEESSFAGSSLIIDTTTDENLSVSFEDMITINSTNGYGIVYISTEVGQLGPAITERDGASKLGDYPKPLVNEEPDGEFEEIIN